MKQCAFLPRDSPAPIIPRQSNRQRILAALTELLTGLPAEELLIHQDLQSLTREMTGDGDLGVICHMLGVLNLVARDESIADALLSAGWSPFFAAAFMEGTDDQLHELLYAVVSQLNSCHITNSNTFETVSRAEDHCAAGALENRVASQ